jgi:excisionase family DNA binding protein
LAPPGLTLESGEEHVADERRSSTALLHLKEDRPSNGVAPLLTLAEVSRLLQLNERTIRRMIARRALPCFRLGRQLRFDAQALSQWLSAREEG